MNPERNLPTTVLIVAFLNLAYFGVQFAVAIKIQSVSLFADSIDFLEDACVNLLIFFALGWHPQRRAWVGMFLAALLLTPALATLWSLGQKLYSPLVPDPLALSLTGLGALVVNLTCSFLLARFRYQGGSLAKAAFFSARNDALANIAIIGAGWLTAVQPSPWPDVVVGVGIFLINCDAARQVYRAAQREL